MLPYQIIFLLSLSILLPAIAASVKVRHKPILAPLLICFYLGLITSILFYFLKDHTHKNSIANAYVLAAFILLLYQLHRWGIAFRKNRLFAMLTVGILLWIYSSFFIFSIGERNVVFRIFYSLMLVLSSIELLNKLAFERIRLSTDYRFLITLGFVIFYTYNIIVETLVISGTQFTAEFLLYIFLIKTYLNFSINILYFIALLCIPAKKKFSFLSSPSV